MKTVRALLVDDSACRLRLRGQVQGVGMRPTIWRLANQLGIHGTVFNEGADVIIDVHNGEDAAESLWQALKVQLPPLANVMTVDRVLIETSASVSTGFFITESEAGEAGSMALPDAAPCGACIKEISDPASRRFRYPFTSCTHCGPRLSIQKAVPWDRDNSSMADFPMCEACRAEYENPHDRRFHAQPIACPACGPRLQLLAGDGCVLQHSFPDEIAATAALLREGKIVAIKGLGGFHLACDATRRDTVSRLRAVRRREAKPFAVMAPCMSMIENCCEVDPASREALQGREAPIVILPARAGNPLPVEEIAPGLNSLGMMLPSTPLHQLLLSEFGHFLVMTSGNPSDEPPCIGNDEALEKLAGIADVFLLHDREIVNRLDDPILRPMAGEARIMRLARGLAPTSLPLPPGLKVETPVLGMGAELKASFCMLGHDNAIVGQHIGDLEQASNLDDYLRSLDLYQSLFRFRPGVLAVDLHSEYLSRKHALCMAETQALEVESVQHHHAHIAACLAENSVPVQAGPVIGLALDGLGMGLKGELWGGECLLADYRDFRRLGGIEPVPLLGGMQAMLAPWRNGFAQLAHNRAWHDIDDQFGDLEWLQWLKQKPLETLARMAETGWQSPACSSAGRCFDAVAAALGLCRERQAYEGQAAMMLESIVDQDALRETRGAYPFSLIERESLQLTMSTLWPLLFSDIQQNVPVGVMAARFHMGLANGLASLVEACGTEHPEVKTVALSGGVFQNRVLFELTMGKLERLGYKVLSHRRVPANDGGIALGQAVIAAARRMDRTAGGMC